MISILAPSRGRAEICFANLQKWFLACRDYFDVEWIISVDSDDPNLSRYHDHYRITSKRACKLIVNDNRSAVDAINNAAFNADGNILMIVSDDTECFDGWPRAILKELEGKEDFILKTQDGIQPWIITNPILDRAYYNRTGYIYDPDFRHQFVDTWMTVQADISGRKLTSNLMFRHLNDTIKDDVRKRSDATWDEGQRTFIQKLKQTPVEDLRKITDQSMKNWIRTHAGIRL